MRVSLSFDRNSWIYKLDYKRIILIALLTRIILACIYDIFVAVSGRDILLPDSKFYSVRGRYISLLLNGYEQEQFSMDMIPDDEESHKIFFGIMEECKGNLPPLANLNNIFSYIIGVLYFLFGYHTIVVRIFNIIISIFGTFLLFLVAKKQFGITVANIFLLIGLFLPTQVGYSIMLCKDFLVMFVISIITWGVYG